MAIDQESEEDSWRRIHTRMGQECSRVAEQAVYIRAAKKRVFRVIYFIIGLESVLESAAEWSQD
jgi:hypothetical protein